MQLNIPVISIKNLKILHCYLGEQKICLYFPASTCEHLSPSPSDFVNCAKCLHNPSKDAKISICPECGRHKCHIV